MSDRESFGIGLQKSSVPSQPSMHNMRLTFNSDGTAVYKPVTGSSQGYLSGGGGSEGPATPVIQHGLNMAEPMKRKRGRPRKYGPDGTMALALTPVSPAAPPLSGGNSGGLSSPTSPSLMMKKARGRPPGSGSKKQMVAFGSAGVGFTPHVITVKAGEDVSSKIMSFSQHGPRAICILSANGAISNVTLRQAATSGGTVTYEGRFEILSLSGSFLLSESGGQRSRTGGLSVSLAGPDGRVLGGGVAGLLTAASPVQVVVGSFIADTGHKQSKPMNPLGSSAPPKMNPAGAAGTSSPPSRGTLSESSGGPGSPLNQSAGAFNNSTPHGILTNIPWK
ncbi:AT-hook motif nuclear-localized protein 10-like isoform X2 [Magnolia sinica]|uniref:AT-hook motif nuclear-localized protein 10-like isoform X2 n=1 Tax=Magnolia sinica TaxID=86752 RepID=UPI002659B9DB|nr:AT-hook motif nuclear-localized protein 10-like isoform X2 [Magnolia sinica]